MDADLFTGEPAVRRRWSECDYVLEKPFCDVLLNGSAYAPGGRPAERIAVGLQVGTMRKSFAVWGNRLWRAWVWAMRRVSRSHSRVCRFHTTMRLAARTSGCAIPRRRRSYLPNPVGRGWHHHVYPELVIGAPVSNTEEIKDPVRSPSGRYRPMAFGPIGRGWPSRIGHAGTYDQDWIDNVFPFLPADFDSRYFQCAPQDQQIAASAGRRAGAAGQSDGGWAAGIRVPVGRDPYGVFPPSR